MQEACVHALESLEQSLLANKEKNGSAASKLA
jgi:hypothetical protein